MTTHRSDDDARTLPPDDPAQVPAAADLGRPTTVDAAAACVVCTAAGTDEVGAHGSRSEGEIDELAASLLGLGELLLDETGVDEAITHVLQVGAAAFTGDVAVSMTVSEEHGGHRRLVTRDATTEWARELDEWQYQYDEGPCLTADESMAVCVVEDLGADERFPRFGRVASSMGVQACVSYPMAVRGQSLGSLNVFSTSVGHIDDSFVQRGEWLARTSAPLLSNWLAHTRVARLADQLQEALAGRGVIERAKGVLMGELGISEDRAFEVLRAQSQHENTKLREVARTLLATRGSA